MKHTVTKKSVNETKNSLIRSVPHETQFVLHGLWPQPRNNIYCHVDKELIDADKNRRWRDLPCLALDAEVETALKKVMPGFASDLHKHEWVKHGTCYGTQPSDYYRDAIQLTQQVNNSALGRLFSQNIGKMMTLKEVRRVADKTWGKGRGKSIELRCKKGLITELWLHLGGSEIRGNTNTLSSLLRQGKRIKSRCKQGRIDRAGFGR
ncbi:MAG: hypothetical protein Q9M36_05025 [Sulfurovum sp.]|nr:hypothetical protein [Sulfurovum sp.]